MIVSSERGELPSVFVDRQPKRYLLPLLSPVTWKVVEMPSYAVILVMTSLSPSPLSL